jgi:hypothetical protein
MKGLTAKILKHISTLEDGETYDLARVFAVFIIPLYMAMGWFELVKTPTERAFDFQAFGIGFGAVLTGLGAFLFLKKDTEPKAAETPRTDGGA